VLTDTSGNEIAKDGQEQKNPQESVDSIDAKTKRDSGLAGNSSDDSEPGLGGMASG
jgi:hypothetical protein